jgi:hypothetical protein
MTGSPRACPERSRRVPGGPSIACPAQLIPVDPQCQASTTSTVLPSHSRTGSASTMSDFGAQHTAYDLAVYASPLRLPSRRKTRFRLAATLGRAGLIPVRSVRKVSETPPSQLTHVISSPFPRLRLAHAWYLLDLLLAPLGNHLVVVLGHHIESIERWCGDFMPRPAFRHPE